jgi:acyl-CoA synthetase (AMP-forming)/AMP-acid ligase II
MTFAQLDQAAARVARLLEQHGLKQGDTVLVLQPMSAELYVVLLALFQRGLVAMFLDPSAGRVHVNRCCALRAPQALIASAKAHLLRLFVPAVRRIPKKFVIGFPVPCATSLSAADRLEPLAEIHECADDTPALLTFTSGSTGQPKAAVRNHGFLLAQHDALVRSLKLTAGDVDLATLPIVALANLGSGVTSLIPNADLRYPGAIDPGPVVEQIRTHQTTSSVASPAFFECLVRHCLVEQKTLPSLTKLFTGGAPVFPRLLEQMQTMAPSAEVVALYGSTEAEPIAHVSRHEILPDDQAAMLSGKGLLAGPPVDTIRLRIMRDRWGQPIAPCTQAEFEANRCQPGQAGEIVVSGDYVLQGYLNGVGDEETKFRVDGVIWHRTGDAGYVDAQGRLWLLGRCIARIRDTAGDLWPFAVETAVYQDARVRRAAFVEHRGKRILAIEFYPAGDTMDVQALRQSLSWARVDEVRMCRTVPVDSRHNAKIDYPALLQMLDRQK